MEQVQLNPPSLAANNLSPDQSPHHLHGEMFRPNERRRVHRGFSALPDEEDEAFVVFAAVNEAGGSSDSFRR